MKSALPLLSLVLVFASCTTAYKSGQTPDDVYFSPQPERNEYVQRDRQDDNRYYGDEEYRDDRYLRMKIADRRYAGLYDDYYSYNPYYYHYYNGSLAYNSPWSSYSYWNYYYNPYCSHVVIGSTPITLVYSHPRTFDLGMYNGSGGSGHGTRSYGNGSNGYYPSGNTNNYRGSGSNAGNFLRNAFSNNSSSSSGSSNNSSSGGSRGSSSSGGGSTNAPARRF